MNNWVLRGEKILIENNFREAEVFIVNGKIKEIRQRNERGSRQTIDAGKVPVLPGLVDTHVHVNEPGRTEWEGFETATQAALAGGITTIVDMPLNSIPVTTTNDSLEQKRFAARGRCYADFGFWGGVIPGNEKELEKMLDNGILGFKTFLVHSGIEEFPNTSEIDLRRAMPILAAAGAPLLVHAELACCAAPDPAAAPRKFSAYLASRPAAWENEAVRMVCRLAKEFSCRVHIVHLSSAGALPILAQAKNEGAPVTAETCPHYLTFAAEDVPEGATEFKCSPPIRERENREKLWKALENGLIDFVVSDHSPCSPELKLQGEGDFARAWGGISSVQLGLPAVWTEASQREISLARVAAWMSEKPAAFAGLASKGLIAPGRDADFTLFDPDGVTAVEPSMLRHRHKLTPYLRRKLRGRVRSVYLRGERAYHEGDYLETPSGLETNEIQRTHRSRRV